MIAMSGGVDSSVSAYLMQRSGFACSGATMRLHCYQAAQSENGSDDVEDARRVSHKLGMPFHVFDAQDPWGTGSAGRRGYTDGGRQSPQHCAPAPGSAW